MLCGVLSLAAGHAPGVAQQPSADAATMARLASTLDGVEAVRAVKRLQTTYAQYAQAGLWGEMADLFADDAAFVEGTVAVHGRAAIGEHFRAVFGHGREGIPGRALYTRMIVRPIVNVSPDGLSAKGRWSELSMTGSYGGRADWAGGIYENDYVREGGVWKIARSNFVPMFAGPYEQGWRPDPTAPLIIPYHFTADDAGRPVPAGYTAPAGAPPTLSAMEQRIDRMLDENRVLNLQNAYGHYIDRKMWDDVVDLFEADGAIELAGTGIYRGKEGIRRALELAGPATLEAGELNEHPLFDAIVSISPLGTQARTRTLQMSQLGDASEGTASLGLAVLEFRFRKQGGTWRIRELRSYPYMNTDYYQGWAKSRIGPLKAPPELAPDAPSPTQYGMANQVVPDIFYANPVSGRPARYPDGALVPGQDQLAPARDGSAVETARSYAVAEVKRKLMMVAAYDGVENISSAFGTWNDDLQWDKFSALFAREGWRGKAMLGFYIGPERIRQAEISSRGTIKTPGGISQLHFRMQPVINVAEDGRSAKLRSRYMHLTTGGADVSGTFAAGIYANDAAVLEDGVWKFSNAAIDDSYFESTSYKDGWARPQAPKPGSTGLSPWIARMFAEFPPDVPNSAMPFRQQGAIPGALIRWPDIKPMFFHYANPVSGRIPEWFCPDEHTCDPAMDTSR